MYLVKQFGKKLLKINHDSNVTPAGNLVHLGTVHHGYLLPDGLLNESSICYCVGAGDDISFDTELVVKYNSNVYIFDPSPEGISHYLKVVEKTNKGDKLTIGGNGVFYDYVIKPQHLSKLHYIEIGLWNQETTLKFFNPQIKDYVSRSVLLFNDAKDVIECKVDRLSNLMKKLGHTKIDLLKLEIEGAEYTVLDTIVADKLDVKIILVEYDEVFHAKGPGYLFRIKRSTDNLLNAGYKLIHSTAQFKRIFVKEEIYKKLKTDSYQ